MLFEHRDGIMVSGSFANGDVLWIERLARITKLEKLGKILMGREGIGPYLYLWIIFSISHLIFNGSIFLTTGEVNYGSFWSLTIVVGLTFGVWAIKNMKEKYHTTIKELNLSNKSNFYNKWPALSKKFFLVSSILVLTTYNIVYFNDMSEFLSPIGMIAHSAIQLVYITPIVAEFVAMIFNIHLFFPKQFVHARPDLDFSDPYRKGGTESVGDLILTSSKMYFIGLSLFTLFPLYITFFYSEEYLFTLGPYTTLFFLGGWKVGLWIFFAPQIRIHKYLKEEKRKKIENIHHEIQMIETEDEVKTEQLIQCVKKYLQLENVRQQSEYPFDTDKVRQLLSMAVIPLLLLLLEILLNWQL